MLEWIRFEVVISVLSLVVTVYFWLVQSRKERPRLKVHQLYDFRTTLRRNHRDENRKRLGITQIDTGGLLIANHSSRQNSIVAFDCYLLHEGHWIKGDWGFTGEDKPPWNIPPESSLGISPACFFDVPEDYEVEEDVTFRIAFQTVNGSPVTESFQLKAA